MRILTNLIQAIAIVVLIAAALLLVIDPRLRSLVAEDLALINPLGKSSQGEATTTQSPPPSSKGKETPKESPKGPPKVTDNGYAIAPQCALWPVEGIDLYYSPADPTTICVQAPGSAVEAGSPLPSGAEMPPNCDTAPDGVVYCIAGERLTADTLRGFFDRGELQTPHEPKGNGG